MRNMGQIFLLFPSILSPLKFQHSQSIRCHFELERNSRGKEGVSFAEHIAVHLRVGFRRKDRVSITAGQQAMSAEIHGSAGTNAE